MSVKEIGFLGIEWTVMPGRAVYVDALMLILGAVLFYTLIKLILVIIKTYKHRQYMKVGSRPETQKHMKRVNELLHIFRVTLNCKGWEHDLSKLEDPELSIFDEFTPKLKGVTYGSDEYKSFLASMKLALDHHYAHNAHHPEHFKEGVDGMDLADLVEMFMDWKAASERHADGDIMQSIFKNTERFNLSPQLVKILQNTARRQFGINDAS